MCRECREESKNSYECREELAGREGKRRKRRKEKKRKGARDAAVLLVGIAEADRAPYRRGRGRLDGAVGGDTTRRVHGPCRNLVVGFDGNDNHPYSALPKTISPYSSSPGTISSSRLRPHRLDSIFEKKKICVLVPELNNFRAILKKN